MSSSGPPRARDDRLARVYAGVLSAADAALQRPLLAAGLGALLVTLVASATNEWILQDFANSGDEYNYLYQAETFAAGRLWNAPLNPPQVFATNYIVQERGRVFSSFPFGWPLLLAGALEAGIPVWAVNPLLAAVTVWLVWWLGTRLYSGRVGVLAAVLVAVSPFFLFNAASYFSHTFCGVLLLGAACTASRDDRRPAWVPVLVGVLVGWAVVARYLTGVVCGVPIVLWLLRPDPRSQTLNVNRGQTLALVALGGVPWVVALAAYNEAMTDNPLRLTTTALTVSLWFREGWLLRSADILSTHLLRHLLWTPPVLVLAYFYFLRRAPRDLRRGPLDWMLALTVVVLYFYVERGGNQYGPRFHYEVFLFATVFVAANVFRLPTLVGAPSRDRWAFGLLAGSVLVMPLAFAAHAITERRVVLERMDPFVQVERAGLQDALVLIADRVGTIRTMGAADLTRNGIDYEDEVLFGLDQADDQPCRWARLVPDRAPYFYAWDHAASKGQLSRLDCVKAPAAPTPPGP